MMSHRLSSRAGQASLALALTLMGGAIAASWMPPASAQSLSPSMVSVVGASLAAASTASAPAGAVELSPTPPNITQAVPPNIVVTFDDSGSMASNYMGDNRPFDNGSWSGPWRCAGVIDPRSTSGIKSRAMNGVYYNPNVVYTPPIKADGSSFPNADQTLVGVPEDAIGVNRPFNKKTLALDLNGWGGFNNNPNGTTDPTAGTYMLGTKSFKYPQSGWFVPTGGSKTDYSTWVYGAFPVNGSGPYSTNASNKRPTKASDTLTGSYPTSSGDKRWLCGYDSTSPMDSSVKGPDGSNYPDGGPYYYRLKSTVTIAVDSYGNPTNPTGQTALYKTSNWEAVAIPNTTVTINGVSVNQWQNFANWYAYYRTRNLMTRTALSRVFGSIGSATSTGGFGSTIRVAWQNLYTSDTFYLQDKTIISGLLDANVTTTCDPSAADPSVIALQSTTGRFTTPPNCYRSAFFNWIFSVPATDTTPARASAIRAGKFYQRGSNNTGATGDLHDPYWEPPQKTNTDGNELSCRQNYHMLVTDGYWNENDPTLPSPFQDGQTSVQLPDGTQFSASAAESRVYWDVQGTKYTSSQANIAFNYWATNLRPDLYSPANNKIVPPYMPDSTTGVVPGATSTDLEKYFNPNNDPANWPHMVEYMVTLGVPGKLNFSNDADCTVDPNNDLCALRKGQTNSTGSAGWPTPKNNAPEGIDDTWHAAINSRGAYFNAGNPQNLVDQLTNILTNISARNVPATTSALNTAVLVQGALGFKTGYSSADWTGVLQAVTAAADGTVAGIIWDAGNILTDPTKTDPTTRQILTSTQNTDGSFNAGVAFKTLTTLDSAGQTTITGTPASVGSTDTGQARIDYLRGSRALETSGVYRVRSSVLGAIIDSQAVYVAYPASGYLDNWPSGSAEANAIAGDATNCATSNSCHTYEQFVKNHLTRKPIVYVGANDGMLHAFDASMQQDTSTPPQMVATATAGKEVFAYVPRATYANLGNLTVKTNFKFQPTVDGIPVTRDVYFQSGSASVQGWHTILVGGLRLGGRGVYALDITDPTTVTETNAGSKVLWEFTAATPKTDSANDPANLGYTYGQPNIGRLANGKWVVLVPGGYFPDCYQPDKPNPCTTLPGASNTFSSLFVLDAQTGSLIREIRTPTNITGVSSHGLSSPVLGDYNNDQIDDVAFAGDLDGNLWRYDLTSTDSSQWSVSLAYQPTTAGAQPITSMPRLFPDPATNRFMVVFGTGKYLGAGDNTSTSAATQSIYGVRDFNNGTPAKRSTMQSQTLSETTTDNGLNTARGLTDNALSLTQTGWYIDLNLTTAAGERVVVTPGALFDTNRAVITTLIPSTNDPCSASIEGALMVLNAATGGSGGGLSAPAVTAWAAAGSTVKVVGARVNNPPTTGSVPVATTVGGGQLLVPGLGLYGGGSLSIDDAIWRRRSWRPLNNTN